MTADFTTTIVVDRTPKEVFNAINNVRGWWSEEIEGPTDELFETFEYRYLDMQRCKMRVMKLVPARSIAWLVLENHFSFTEDKTEWTKTKMLFEISRQGEKTKVDFTHVGLVPDYECYDVCSDAWGTYIRGSLRNLIATGRGQPNVREGALIGRAH